MIFWLLSHWPWLAGGGLLLAIVAFPAPAALIARWLIGTQTGRYLLAAAVVVGCLCWLWTSRYAAGYAAAVADQARAAESAKRTAAAQSVKRDAQSDQATAAARAGADARQTEHETRAARVEGIAHAERPAVPAVCPDPDPALHRELQDGARRVSAAEDRLRRYGPAAGAPAK